MGHGSNAENKLERKLTWLLLMCLIEIKCRRQKSVIKRLFSHKKLGLSLHYLLTGESLWDECCGGQLWVRGELFTVEEDSKPGAFCSCAGAFEASVTTEGGCVFTGWCCVTGGADDNAPYGAFAVVKLEFPEVVVELALNAFTVGLQKWKKNNFKYAVHALLLALPMCIYIEHPSQHAETQLPKTEILFSQLGDSNKFFRKFPSLPTDVCLKISEFVAAQYFKTQCSSLSLQ